MECHGSIQQLRTSDAGASPYLRALSVGMFGYYKTITGVDGIAAVKSLGELSRLRVMRLLLSERVGVNAIVECLAMSSNERMRTKHDERRSLSHRLKSGCSNW